MIMNSISDMKRKGLSYKDVRRPFFCFQRWGGIATKK